VIVVSVAQRLKALCIEKYCFYLKTLRENYSSSALMLASAVVLKKLNLYAGSGAFVKLSFQ